MRGRGSGMSHPGRASTPIPGGTRIPVRTVSTLSTQHAAAGSTFNALLERDLVVDGVVLAREGSSVSGIVVSSDPGGRVKGVASLAVSARLD